MQSGSSRFFLGNVSGLAAALGGGELGPHPGVVNHVRWFMDKGRSFSLFVFHGGTNFGFSAGANNGGRENTSRT